MSKYENGIYENDAIRVLADFDAGETPLPNIVVVGMGKLRSIWWQQKKMFCTVDPFTSKKLYRTFECKTVALSVCMNAIVMVRNSIFDMVDWFFRNCRTTQQKQMSLCRMLFPYQLNNMMIMMWIIRNHATVGLCLLSHVESVIPVQHEAFSELKIKHRHVRWRDVLFPTFLHSVREPLKNYIFRVTESIQ
jgi:hypothetical protein